MLKEIDSNNSHVYVNLTVFLYQAEIEAFIRNLLFFKYLAKISYLLSARSLLKQSNAGHFIGGCTRVVLHSKEIEKELLIPIDKDQKRALNVVWSNLSFKQDNVVNEYIYRLHKCLHWR
ncbi:hypothetical protein M9Y10_036413 [Tritrichomonas musculus]|uniref:Uncharacterized protein n=1 Tax=Tritrichomonas musculus TaxID=1915356 RepID=A0ABR2GTZ7_9EUKA